ncbi:MAG: BamA/TamA family outer membrane protein [Proteobacteria bacterium]|nr:BamA/TamA family outer membrane protein [Pseudomonadota bacterium]
MNRPQTLFTLALATTTLASTLVSVAAAQTIPGAAQPGRTRENIAPSAVAPTPATEVVAPSNLLAAPANAAEITFTLKSLNITGNSAFTDEELSALAKNMMGQKITLADIYTLANQITNFYRAHGFIISQAIVPPQEIAKGNVTIRVVEGFVDDIQFKTEGGSKLNQRQLNRAAAAIRASKPLNQAVLERQMLLLNDLGGVTARAVVEPSQNTIGAANLVIEVKRKKVSGSLQVDNHGSRYIGPVQYQARASVSGVAADYDQLDLLYATTSDFNEMRLGEVRHTIPIGSNGLKAMWRAEYSETAPGSTLKAFNVQGKDLTLEAGVSYPIIRGRQKNLEAFGTLAWESLQTKSLGSKISSEKVSVAKAGVNYDQIDSFHGRGLATASVSKGLGILGASSEGDPLLSRLNANPEFTKVNAEASREQFFTGLPFSVVTAVQAQYSPDSLIASQEFGIGGSTYGRGYDPSEITGDSGAAAKLEGRYTQNTTDNKWVKTWQPYAFYDVGFTVDNKTGTGVDARNSLASAGTGLRLALADDFALEGELAVPLSRRVAAQGDKGLRAFFTLSKAF